MSGRPMFRRPARVFGGLTWRPCALVSSSASRTLITLPSRSTFSHRSAKNLAEPHPGEQGHDCRGIHLVARQLRDDRSDPFAVEDCHLAGLDPRRRLKLGDIARHHVVPHGIVEGVRKQAMCVNDGPRRDTSVAAAAAAVLSVACHFSTSTVESFCTSRAPMWGRICPSSSWR